MKIYTGGGDRGKTSLFSGERMSKGHARIAAYGEVDELNSVIGAVRAALPDALGNLAQELCRIQSDLFDVGAWLATSADAASRERLRPVTEDWAAFLEEAMDRMDAELPELRTFVLPGGHMAAAWAHVARTVCRRCERHVVGLAESAGDRAAGHDVPEGVRVYLNRLSDYLFVLARAINHSQKVSENPWQR
ncbi:MAG: cob(I)yrinic acid a,c-diamide adenosyltransferase [Desulfobacterales bacterium]|nr:cob(I)yrinic acid a,c-diamide adenosyltransferase [Desulfobacterales bacterium]